MIRLRAPGWVVTVATSARRATTAASPAPPSFGVALDIDGVLVRGKRALPGAADALRRLDAAGVPYALLTNGGGTLEEVKARSVSACLGVDVPASRVVLSHTPMRGEASAWRQRRVMVLGCRDELNVARAYGFPRVVSPQRLAVQHPETYDNWNRALAPPAEVAAALADPHRDDPVEAILVLHDPVDWHLEIQLCLDVLRGHLVYGADAPRGSAVTVFNTNDDLEFAGTHPYPRIAQGLFVETLQHLYERLTGEELRVKRFGKPHRVQFEFVRELLSAPARRGAGDTAPPLSRMYMVGDNPAADVRGANGAKPHWESILVRSGMFRGVAAEELPLSDRPDVLVDGVGDAVEWILRKET